MKELDGNKKIVTLVIPEIIKIDSSLIEGDLTSGVRFEVTNEEVKSYPEYFIQIRERGARIFITEDDNYLVIHSPNSLKYHERIRDIQDYYSV
ncbi:MAG: hypothetical protein Q8Q30_03025 [Candidatus Woesebacteria bacterium]|nr:hypothetical protein [Candidatus Woesebacteria bacterium]